jgi:hypothetical protein
VYIFVTFCNNCLHMIGAHDRCQHCSPSTQTRYSNFVSSFLKIIGKFYFWPHKQTKGRKEARKEAIVAHRGALKLIKMIILTFFSSYLIRICGNFGGKKWIFCIEIFPIRWPKSKMLTSLPGHAPLRRGTNKKC